MRRAAAFVLGTITGTSLLVAAKLSNTSIDGDTSNTGDATGKQTADLKLPANVALNGITGNGNGNYYAADSNSGSIYRMVVDFSQPGLARATTSLGQSGHPSSRHYRDQTPLWLADTYKPLWMDEADVLANLEGTTILKPPD